MSTTGFYRLTFKLGRRGQVEGIDLRALLPSDDDWRRIQARVSEALHLIRTLSPIRFAHFKRDIRRIWIMGMATARGSYVYEEAMCVLDYDYVIHSETRVEELALTLVHEGTHARLRRSGFGYEEPIRARIERICIRSELSVARRMSDSADLIAQRERRLQWDDAEWSIETRQKDNLEALRELGWSGNLAYRITKFVTERRAAQTWR